MIRITMPARALLAAAGAALIAAALVWSGADIERAVNAASGSLAWGPALFRGMLVFHGLVLLITAWRYRARPPASPQHRTSPAVWGCLIALTLVALGLRLWRLESGLWLDEVHTLVEFANLPFYEQITRFGDSKNQHVLFSLLAHLAMRVFGESAWALRLPAVLFGVGSLWTLFLLGRDLIGVRASLLACALMTVSYHHIWFSQNARGYTGLLFFALLSTWLWRKGLLYPTWRVWSGYAIAGFLGIWVQMTMIFVLAAHGLVWLAALWRWRNLEPGARWMPAAAWLLCGTLTIQAMALALPDFLASGIHEASAANSDWTNPLWMLRESLHSLRIGFSGVAAVAAGGMLLLAGWVSLFRKDWRVASGLVLPTFVAVAAAIALEHNLFPRYFFFSMGFALLILVHGATRVAELVFPPGSRWPARAAAALIGLIILASAATVPRCYALPKQDYVGARVFAQAHRPAYPVAAIGTAAMVYEKYYAPHWMFPRTAAELDALRTKYPGLLLVYTLPIQIQVFHADMWSIVQTHFTTLRVFPGTLNGGEVFVAGAHSPATAAMQ